MKGDKPTSFRLAEIGGIVWPICSLGCVVEAPTLLPSTDARMILIAVRAIAVITGDRERRFGPEVRHVELWQQQSGERYNVTVEADDKVVTFFLPPGEYDITRVQISEGPFLSIAQLSASFSIDGGEEMIFMGTWRFGIDSPRYGRMVLVSMIPAEDTRQQVERTVRTQYPAFAGKSLSTVIPSPEKPRPGSLKCCPILATPNIFSAISGRSSHCANGICRTCR